MEAKVTQVVHHVCVSRADACQHLLLLLTYIFRCGSLLNKYRGQLLKLLPFLSFLDFVVNAAAFENDVFFFFGTFL